VLLRTLFALLLLAALAESIVHAAHALAQTVVRRQALRAVHAQIDAAVASAQTAVAAAIAAGNDPASPNPTTPAPVATCRAMTQNGCVLVASATVSFPDATAQPQASPCAGGACTIYEQGNDAVDEGRIDAVVDAQVTGPDGVALASRSTRVTFRTMRVSPYAIVAGKADATSGTPVEDAAGDDGGAAPNGAAPGTSIDVLYQNRSTGATLPANVWHAAVQQNAGSVPAWSP
jgi:hypothetical protein